jgi:hypothetical protein
MLLPPCQTRRASLGAAFFRSKSIFWDIAFLMLTQWAELNSVCTNNKVGQSDREKNLGKGLLWALFSICGIAMSDGQIS